MTRDIGDLMWRATGARAADLEGLAPAEVDLAALRGRVRRGRRVRHAREVAVALPVVAAVAAAGWFGIDRLTEPAPPAITPTPVVPAPDPTPSPGPDELVLGDPIDRPGLPTYYEMPDGLLAQTGPGWLVTSHQPSSTSGPGGTYVSEAYAVFLVAPDGTHYLVAEYEHTANLFPVAWEAGATRVAVVVDTATAGLADERPEQDLMPGWLDLRTGRITERDGTEATWPPTNEPPLPVSPSGRKVGGVEFSDFFTLWAVDGTGTQLAYQVPGTCAPIGWLDDQAFLALCVDAAEGELDPSWLTERIRSADPRLVRVSVAAGEATSSVLRRIEPGDPLPEPGGGVWVRDGVVAFPSLGETFEGEAVQGFRLPCWTGVDAWDGRELVSVQRPVGPGPEYVKDLRSAGGAVYVEAAPGCRSAVDFALTGHEVGTGSTVVLAPAPGGEWTQGLVAWAVAE